MDRELCSISTTLLLMTSLCVTVHSLNLVTASKPAPSFHYVKSLDLQALKDLKNTGSLSVIYYYSKDFPNSAAFFEEFEKSAKLLEAYAITLAIFNCTEHIEKDEKCSVDGAELFVYTYQHYGVELLPLEMETMFDVNSIMSNALQLALLQEVPIVQSRLERQSLEKSYAGHHDLIFAFPQAVGTHEHRIFMEIAYTFQDKYKFALTTEFKSIVGLQESKSINPSTKFALWALFCSDLSEDDLINSESCHSVLYKGEATLLSVANYMKRLSEQTLFNAPGDGTASLFQLDDSCPTIYVYDIKTDDTQFLDLIDVLVDECKGYARVVFVDMSDNECRLEAEKQGFDGNLPALSVKTSADGITFMVSDGEWDSSSIDSFLFPLIFPDVHKRQEEEDEAMSEDLDASNDVSNLIQEVETQDDQVAKAVFSTHGKKLRSVQVPSLLKSSFDQAIKDRDLKIILFYLPFDAISMAFLLDFDEAWKTLSAELPEKDILARVNCFDATDLCAIQNITTYPLLRIFQREKSSQLYEGPLDAQSLLKAVKLLMLKGPIVLETEKEIEGFVSGEFPQNLSDFISTSVLFLARPKDKGANEVFDSASTQLSTYYMLGIIKENMLNFFINKYKVDVPSVVCFNRKDAIKPMKVLQTVANASMVVKFVKHAAIPTMPELGVANFPILYAMRRPFVILFMDPKDPLSDVVKETVTQVESLFENANFCWMDAHMKSMGIRLLSEYTWTATLPVITVVDHTKSQVFNFHFKTLMKEEFIDWLKSVFDGKLEPSKHLHEKNWKAPGQHYDFLAMIDEEKEASGLVENDDLDDGLKRGQRSVVSNPEVEEYLKIENEIREELLELRKSRLYQYPELKQKTVLFVDHEEQGETDEKKKMDTHIHDHIEL